MIPREKPYALAIEVIWDFISVFTQGFHRQWIVSSIFCTVPLHRSHTVKWAPFCMCMAQGGKGNSLCNMSGWTWPNFTCHIPERQENAVTQDPELCGDRFSRVSNQDTWTFVSLGFFLGWGKADLHWKICSFMFTFLKCVGYILNMG